MVYINLRLNLEDYGKWRAGFDANDAMRRAGGSTGVYQVYRDVDNPNTVSLILEWEDAGKAQAFLNKRGFVIPEDVRSICKDVLRHRIGLTYEAEAENVKVEDVIEDVLRQINVP